MKLVKLFILIFIVLIILQMSSLQNIKQDVGLNGPEGPTWEDIVLETPKTHPLMIEQMRLASYQGSEITIEQELASGSNYKRYVASYISDGLKIYALLTIPNSPDQTEKYPAIIFNHGYIPPEVYRTTERYVSYVDGFARNGYVVFKPDYRGHGNSEGRPEGAYYSPAYTRDVLNAFNSLKNLPQVNPEKIGMWGHSMGGHITLRSMVISPDIKAGVIWAGVVASYEDMATNWRRASTWMPSSRENMASRPSRTQLIEEFGSFDENPQFWQSISPIYFVSDISGPVQIHHGTADLSVPWEFSEYLKNALENEGKDYEYFLYEGADHNLSGSAFSPAISRSVAFFDKYLK
jgi:uncharacterized protein